VRIVAGKYRRRKLLTNSGCTTRPITDRAKEILFERLAEDIDGKRIADIFAGTGTLGLEALSRGARSVVFIENDHRAFELLNKNVDTLGVRDDVLCWRADVLRTSFRPKGVDEMLPYDTVFFDPPYRMVADLAPGGLLYRSLERVARESVTVPGALLVLRTPSESTFILPPCWLKERQHDISSMEIHVFAKQ
jgi:16S rRNA (guanine966-N2)-methyltransferase